MTTALVYVLHLLMLFLLIRLEVRAAQTRREVARIDTLMSVWASTWGQPPDAVKAVLDQALAALDRRQR